MKNASPVNAPNTTIPVGYIEVVTQVRVQDGKAEFLCEPRFFDEEGKSFFLPRLELMNEDERKAFQVAIQNGIQAASEQASLSYLNRVFGFIPEQPVTAVAAE